MSHAYERAYLYHVRQYGVLRGMEMLHACYGQQVGTYAVYLCAHAAKHSA